MERKKKLTQRSGAAQSAQVRQISVCPRSISTDQPRSTTADRFLDVFGGHGAGDFHRRPVGFVLEGFDEIDKDGDALIALPQPGEGRFAGVDLVLEFFLELL